MKQYSKNSIAINYGALSYQFSGHLKYVWILVLNHCPADSIFFPYMKWSFMQRFEIYVFMVEQSEI